MPRKRKFQILRGIDLSTTPLNDGEFGLQRASDGSNARPFIGTNNTVAGNKEISLIGHTHNEYINPTSLSLTKASDGTAGTLIVLTGDSTATNIMKQKTLTPGSNIQITGAVGTITISATDTVYTHPTPARTNNTSTAAPGSAGTFTVVDSITTSTEGHITAVNTKTVTMPTSTNNAGTVTSITPGVGFTSAVAITSSGTLNCAIANNTTQGIISITNQVFGGKKSFGIESDTTAPINLTPRSIGKNITSIANGDMWIGLKSDYELGNLYSRIEGVTQNFISQFRVELPNTTDCVKIADFLGSISLDSKTYYGDFIIELTYGGGYGPPLVGREIISRDWNGVRRHTAPGHTGSYINIYTDNAMGSSARSLWISSLTTVCAGYVNVKVLHYSPGCNFGPELGKQTGSTGLTAISSTRSWFGSITVSEGGTGMSSNAADRIFYGGASASAALRQLAFPSTTGSFLKQDTSGSPYWIAPRNITNDIGTTWTGSLSSSGWSATEPYTQALTIAGVLSSDIVMADLNIASPTASQLLQWSKVCAVSTSADTITFTARGSAAPSVTLSVMMRTV